MTPAWINGRQSFARGERFVTTQRHPTGELRYAVYVVRLRARDATGTADLLAEFRSKRAACAWAPARGRA